MADRRSSMMEKAEANVIYMRSLEATEKTQTGANTTDVDGSPQDPVAQQHELLVSEIESTDGHLGTALRSIYDGPEPEKFLDHLDARIKAHDKEIEAMCNHHYQGFIESVHSLLQVRSDVEKLKNEIQTTNKDLKKSGQAVLTKGEELVKHRKIQKNIEAAIETLSLCLPVLEIYGKLREQMAAKRYYPALKTLEQLEHTYLPRVSKYRFSQVMCETIPKLRDSIKEASMSDLKDFLESIRKHSGRIGEVAMKQTAQENNMVPLLTPSKAKKRVAPLPPNSFPGEVERPNGLHSNKSVMEDDPDMEEGVSAQDLIDFSPVYRCLHIYSVLGTKETFESYYRKQRRKQARLALQPPLVMDQAKRLVQSHGKDPKPHETLQGYKTYFHNIVGYFVVEDHILSTTSGLINQTYLDELWETALSKITAVLRTHIGFCTDTDLLLQVKNLIMLFCLTLRGYGFTVSQLYELLLEVRDQYSEILRKVWVEVFNSIFDEDNYTPITVDTEEEYRRITDLYPFKDPDLEAEQFPKRFPFSQFVPRVYSEVKKYINACLKFSEDLHLSMTEKTEMIYNATDNIMQKTLWNGVSELIKRPDLKLVQTEIDDMIRKFANVLLMRTLGGCLAGLIKQPRLTLLQLIQISINMEHLDQSCIFLEDFISNITGARQDNFHASKLQGQSMFKSAKSDAESEIYKQIDVKIDEFFDLASYDWLMGDFDNQPSGYVIDLTSFLKGTFISFTNLPEKVAQTACMSACKHIAERMMCLLKDEEVKSISEFVLQQFSCDLNECEKFANENPVRGLDGITFQMAFADLRQLLNLFLSWEWTSYFADYGKAHSPYVRVSPTTCVILLEKLKESDKKKNNLFTAFKQKERDKKRLVDTVLKQLRQLVNEQLLQQFS